MTKEARWVKSANKKKKEAIFFNSSSSLLNSCLQRKLRRVATGNYCFRVAKQNGFPVTLATASKRAAIWRDVCTVCKALVLKGGTLKHLKAHHAKENDEFAKATGRQRTNWTE